MKKYMKNACFLSKLQKVCVICLKNGQCSLSEG